MTCTTLQATSREDWLDQRDSFITATDMAAIASGSEKVFRTLAKKKAEHKRTRMTKAMKYGHDREPLIALVGTRLERRLRRNEQLLVKDGTRFAATPDMVTNALDIIGEIKTVKGQWTSAADAPKRYHVQMQWQMYVTGADRCIFLWESWKEGEDGKPVQSPVQWEWVEADEEAQEKLVETANAFLAYQLPDVTDAAADFEAAILADDLAEVEGELAEARAVVRSLDATRADIQKRLMDHLGGKSGDYQYGDLIVTVTNGRRSTKFDRAAWEADNAGDEALLNKYLITSDGKPSLKIGRV